MRLYVLLCIYVVKEEKRPFVMNFEHDKVLFDGYHLLVNLGEVTLGC